MKRILLVEDSTLFGSSVKEKIESKFECAVHWTKSLKDTEALFAEQEEDFAIGILDFVLPDAQNGDIIDMAIIGISSDEDGVVSAQFIKSGASDFLNKPFLAEEFYCRVTQNLDLLDYIQEVKDLSSKDFLTGLYNRRYFFDLGKKIHASALREKTKIAVATVDIDYFKRVNDTHGHDVGDLVIQSVSNILVNACRETDIVSRFGGEEFCILTPNITPADSLKLFERVRQTIQDSVIQVQGADIRVTASIGVCSTLLKTLDEMIVRSDQMLYRAKNQGRNKVQIT
ncbi:2-C-methyl-D-erythritol 2,4-cyclodiphosphate synthase [Desulfatibacillum aliphaticivorans]|uniref:2-C-methyl-D-erythritol 2,4-cyclodiphosphate synthase n=1 Tax=Desulfatibacillum aliphaticivorans TaxID=218208 RepID=UPI0004219C8D|nr:2-C-methyl-D-erythritol 2,4-cyclodiphosphate synthase [Desulfatibacillum aliphaticivorans]